MNKNWKNVRDASVYFMLHACFALAVAGSGLAFAGVVKHFQLEVVYAIATLALLTSFVMAFIVLVYASRGAAALLFRPKKFSTISEVLRAYERGVFKRIDENRELLELLSHKAPQLLDRNPWVVRWLRSQDSFLSKLAEVAKVESTSWENSPRPWPSQFKLPGDSERPA